MKPEETGKSYDKIASWWNNNLLNSKYGLSYLEKAINLSSQKRNALDVGCGTGGRIISALIKSGYEVTGIDISDEMIKSARLNHPSVNFIKDDICKWNTCDKFDIIIAWDSLFHVPLTIQKSVISKLCTFLSEKGVLLITAGVSEGEKTGSMHHQIFYYSSLNEIEYLKIMKENGCECILLERDQFPEEHIVIIAIKDK